MVDKQVKINSVQAGPFNTRQNLIDFVIPSGMSVDMSKSYINLQSHCESVEPSDGVFDFKLVYTHNGVPHELTAPNSAIVRNCQLKSANKGMLEDVRRSDVLRTNLHYLNNTTEDNDGTLYKQILPHKTRTNHTESIWVDMRGEGNVPSRPLTAPIQIPMSDLFNLGSATISTDFLGDTRVHLEICPERFVPVQLFKASDASFNPSPDFGNDLFTEMVDISGVTAPIFTVTSKIKYEDLADSPFWVSMPVNVRYMITSIGAPGYDVSYNTTISEIEYVRSDILVPDNVGRLKITLAGDFENQPASTDVFSNIVISGRDVGELAFTVDYAEMVLQETDPVKMDGMVFTTYTLQETNGYGATNFAEQFIVEPSAYNIMVFALNENDLLTQKEEIKEYRMRVNNVDATDRNVIVERTTPLYLDRISMYLVNNSEGLKSAVLHTPSALAISNTSRYSELPLRPYMCNPLPVTQGTKIVDLNVVATGGGVDKLCVFKSVIKQL